MNRALSAAAFTIAASGVPAQASDAALPATHTWTALTGLVVVLAVILGSAWLLRRITSAMPRSQGPLQVISTVAVGPRERVVLLSCRDSWVVVGVAPGRVAALHAMPIPAGQESTSGALVEPRTDANNTPPAASLSQWIDKVLAGRAR